jgi:glucose-1-phosphate cytidylyltransferase
VKAVILAGGYGTRIAEETSVRPKPMVEVGGMPILWHIMKIYSAHGINDFVICCGYMGHVIKEYFFHYSLNRCDIAFDLRAGTTTTLSNDVEPWTVTLVDTGNETMTGGRLKRVRKYVDGETFCFTYGDTVGSVDVTDLIAYHRAHDVYATLTAVQPPGRFGALTLEGDEPEITGFEEKPSGDGGWINGGFFVLEPEVFDYIESDATSWEREPLQTLAREGRLAAYRHRGYWWPVDTLRDKNVLDQEWASGSPGWKVW